MKSTRPSAAHVVGRRARRRAGLFGQVPFRRLWIGDSISQLGTQVTLLALPLTAIVYLKATAFQVGLLTAMEFVAFLLFGLPAGAIVDRLRRRPIMIVGDLARFLLLASVPVAALCGILTIWQLLGVALLQGVATVFFDVAYQSYLPVLLPAENLVEGNAKLQASQSVAQAVGPSIAGALVQALTAPVALVADAVSFACSAAFISAIRHDEVAVPVADDRHFGREIGEGLRVVMRHPALRALALTTAVANFSSAAFASVVILFLVRTLHLSAGAIGVLMSAGSIGGILGAVFAGILTRRLGTIRAIWLPLLVGTPLGLLTPLTRPGAGLTYFVLGWFSLSFAIVVYNIGQVSYRQCLCLPRLLGRMNATMRFLTWGVMPFGALLGGYLATVAGARSALWATQAGEVTAAVMLVAGSFRSTATASVPLDREPGR